MAGGIAAETLPDSMPAFFRQSRTRLAYLIPEPDRWRDASERRRDPALDQAFFPDHFIDLELIPGDRRASFFRAPSRFAFADSLRAVGQDPARVGLSPFAMLELTQRLRSSFRRWRTESSAEVRSWIEQRIIDDAGVLGDYVTDASNPAHTTIHFNGWVGDNPRGYATDNTFHSRFESGFVQARVSVADIRAFADAPARVFSDVRSAILDQRNGSQRAGRANVPARQGAPLRCPERCC
jgi:hypothetical protein